jgi:hypothetical protein
MHKGPRWRKLDVGYFVGGEGAAKKLFTTINDLRKVMASGRTLTIMRGWMAQENG